MCGIVGILGSEPVARSIVEALKRLEYRGYDSAGVATIEDGKVMRVRAPGKLHNLEDKLKVMPIKGTTGIGHTRWATHGVPNEPNAHPHISGDVVIVHNGIIENFKPLKDELQKDGYIFTSDTDTEVVAHLIARERAKGAAPRDAVAAVLKRLEGAFALAVLFASEHDLMIGARMGAPLAASAPASTVIVCTVPACHVAVGFTDSTDPDSSHDKSTDVGGTTCTNPATLNYRVSGFDESLVRTVRTFPHVKQAAARRMRSWATNLSSVSLLSLKLPPARVAAG